MTQRVLRERAAPITLRPYQAEAVQAVLSAPQRGVTRPLLVQPTGTGKTVIFSHVIAQRAAQGRALVLAHRDELLEQAIGKLGAVWPDADVGKVAAGSNEVAAGVVVASVQTLARPKRLAQLLDAGAFATVVVDEAHHTQAATYRAILEALGCFSDGGPLLLGVTATPDRADGKGLDATFGEIVHSYPLLAAIGDGYLCDLRGVRVALDVDLRRVKCKPGGKDWADGALGRAMAAADAPRHIVRAWQAHAATRQATVVFTPTVALAEQVALAFGAAGVPAANVSAAPNLAARRALLARFGSGDLKVITNALLLTEGWDEPRTDCLVLARPTKSRGLYAQMVGRGLRRFPGKDDCLVLDVTGASEHHDLVALPSLLGDERRAARVARAVAAGATLSQAAAAAEQPALDGPDGELVWSDIDLLARRSRFAWVQARADLWVLSLVAYGPGGVRERATLMLRQAADDTWSAVGQREHRPARALVAGVSLEMAQGVAEDAARHPAFGGGAMADRAAAWRDRPATAKQRRALRAWRLADADRSDLTAGEASDLMTSAAARRQRAG